MKDFIPCRKCSKKEGPLPGYYYSTNSDGYQTIIECEYHKNWKREKEIETKCKISGILTDHSFDDYVGENSRYEMRCLKNYAESFSNFKEKTMVYLYGANGTQKTTMSHVVGMTLIRNGFSVYFTTMNKLIGYLVKDSGYDQVDDDTSYILSQCENCDLLIIDESFDPSKVTIYKSGYQIPFLDSFLRNRFEINKKSILFISNIKPSFIEANGYGRSLQNFIERNTRNSFLEFKDNYIANSINAVNFFGVER